MGWGEWWRQRDAQYVEAIRRRGDTAPISRRNLVLWWVGLAVLFVATVEVEAALPDSRWWGYAASAPFAVYMAAGWLRLDSPKPWRVRQWVRERVSGGRG